MSFRPIATRTLNKDQFKKEMPPPVPNSAHCPGYMEQPNMSQPIYGSGAGGGASGGGAGDGVSGGGENWHTSGRNWTGERGGDMNGSKWMPTPQQQIRRNVPIMDITPNNLHNRQNVFNFIDRQCVDTRNGSVTGDIGNMGLYNQVQHPHQSSVDMADFLRPQNSRDLNHNYFNRAEKQPSIKGFTQGSFVTQNTPVMKKVEEKKGGGNGGDQMLLKYSNMYKQNNM